MIMRRSNLSLKMCSDFRMNTGSAFILEKICTIKNMFLFLDIETVPQFSSFDDAPKTFQHLWEKKAKFLIRDETETPDSIYRQAGIYAEFGKIVCISCGYFSADRKLRIKSFSSDDEKN